MTKLPAIALLALGMSACALENQEEGEASAALASSRDEAVSVQTLPTAPAANVAAPNCIFNPVIPVGAYNGVTGYALCRFGYTVFPYNGQTQFFIIGADNQMFHTWSSNGGWESLGGFLTGEVYAGTVDGGALRVCALGADTQSWFMKEYTPAHGWGTWQGLGKNPGRCPFQYGPVNF